ncbi:DUF2303 family protein [Dokdonella soli]|uniref:Uncharacterized protein n=1 Tax=Dokdonella soli TaxID=529810 RepID=A0ABN1IV18_9GAMM
MDASAIHEISNLAVEASRANRINPGEFPQFPNGIQAVLVGNEIKTLEHLQRCRSRFRGQFSTTALSEFVGYVKANAATPESKDAAGFIDAKKCTARVYLNLGKPETPGHGDWTASLALDPTAAYAALKKIEGIPQSQKSLVEWIEDWSAQLSAQFGDRAEPTGIALALMAIRNLTISAKSDVTHTDKDFGAARSALEEIAAKADGGIPTHLVFACEPYARSTTRSSARHGLCATSCRTCIAASLGTRHRAPSTRQRSSIRTRPPGQRTA